MRGFLSTPSGALPAFPGTPLVLYWGGADSPCSLFAAAAFSTYDNDGSGTTVIAHGEGVATFNGESVEISGCTSDAAALNGTHTLTASGSNTFSIATPIGLPTTVGPVATGVGVFNPVLRWISQVNDQTGNGYHAVCANRAAAIRWDAVNSRFVRSLQTQQPAIAADGSGGDAYRTAINGKAGVFAVVGSWTGSGQAIGMNAGFTVSFGLNSSTALRLRSGVINNTTAAVSATTNRRLFIGIWDGAAHTLYQNSVGSALASYANTATPSITNAVYFMQHGGTEGQIGTQSLFVQYAGDPLDGAGELDALKAAIDARVEPYPGM